MLGDLVFKILRTKKNAHIVVSIFVTCIFLSIINDFIQNKLILKISTRVTFLLLIINATFIIFNIIIFLLKRNDIS